MNNEVCFRISDLRAPKGKKPLFGQMYCIDPKQAVDIKLSNYAKEQIDVKPEVANLVETMIRANHPFASAYKQADEIFCEESALAVAQARDVPNFRVSFANISYWCREIM